MGLSDAGTPPAWRERVRGGPGKNLSEASYRMSVGLLTFVCYALFHCNRKVPSVVKRVFHPPRGEAGWEPFDDAQGKSLLAGLDFCFLSAYAVGMFFTGHIADSMDLRVYLTLGSAASGALACVYGALYFLNVHTVPVYYALMLAMGLAQSTGYPGVVAVMGNWFGPQKRGLIMGIWAAHMSVGNIVGSLLGAQMLQYGWGWAFVLPGLLLLAFSAVLWLYLAPHPEDVGHVSPTNPHHHAHAHGEAAAAGGEPQDDSALGHVREGRPEPAVPFLTALRLPGVVTYSMCLFFSKLIAYTFLYWLPFYVGSTEIGGRTLTAAEAGRLASLFDVGGIAGGIAIGALADALGAKALTTSLFLLGSIPVLCAYQAYGAVSMQCNSALLLASGVMVTAPYALVTTAISADLGTHASLKGSAQALATVTAIIDGTGSVGAVVGPALTGLVVQFAPTYNDMFYMLYASAVAATLLLARLTALELRAKLFPRNPSDDPSELAAPLLAAARVAS